MPRLFLGNFDFEHRLAEPLRETPAKLQRLNAELATAWLSIADDGDWIWTPSPIDVEFFQRAVQNGLPQVIPVTSFSAVRAGVECVPWGWTPDVRRLAERYGWNANAPADAAVRLANSRATSDELERQWNVGLEQSRRIESLEELHTAIRSLNHADDRWVVKAEFGMSARERILGRGRMTAADENWVRKRVATIGAVFFEPWVKRIGEVGIQIEIPQSGPPHLIGVTPMLVDARGQYAGSWFAFDDSRFPSERALWSEAVEIALRAANHLQSSGYFGPLGADAMVYRDESGVSRIRPLQDINARWTMGRLSLGWKKLLEPEDEGCWQHSATNNTFAVEHFAPTRTVRTSPDLVGRTACQHQSRLLIQSPANHESLPRPEVPAVPMA